jgi:hypothetical protein
MSTKSGPNSGPAGKDLNPETSGLRAQSKNENPPGYMGKDTPHVQYLLSLGDLENSEGIYLFKKSI